MVQNRKETPCNFTGLDTALLEWYDTCRRILPWREDPSPYHVWISEIMLQQTRVEAVKGYYSRFLEHFPDVTSLAQADVDECLKLWEGLGYYSRARSMHKAARQIVEEYGGQMPQTSDGLRRLAGIGPYTSASIASIAFGEKIPAVDGNLLRVFSRLTLYEEPIRTPAAAAGASAFFMEHMPQDRPGDFNQALMDLGACVCTPGIPSCVSREEKSAAVSEKPVCPLQHLCTAFREKRCADLPVMPPKKSRRIEQRTILLVRDNDRVLLRRRPSRGLLAGMYEFPNEDGWLSGQEAVEKARSYGCEPLRIRPLTEAKHVFTHKEWHMRGYEIRVENDPEDPQASAGQQDGMCFFATVSDLREKYAVPSAYAAYLHDL